MLDCILHGSKMHQTYNTYNQA